MMTFIQRGREKACVRDRDRQTERERERERDPGGVCVEGVGGKRKRAREREMMSVCQRRHQSAWTRVFVCVCVYF
jgi:hypothetical protein